MSILQMPESDVSGIAKRLDEAALPLIFDNLQKSQYNYPIPSTIRELVCNAVDSIEERRMAFNILHGTRKVSDYYVEREGDVYRDSRFNPDYYDLQWLSQGKDKVLITYTAEGNNGKDNLSISDYGVGLGGNRLAGYFRLGYSTKRLSTFGIGKYGIGAKAPLSAATFYTVDSWYNGRHYRFNVYSYQVQSIVPPFNADGTRNPFEILDMGNGEELKVHYWVTDRKNGVTISLEAKKHHKEKYIQAIKNQLLYFDNVEFELHHENGRVENIPLTSKVLYEDDYIVLANNHYAKPHILIKKVNYGYIDFQELELEDKLGNIGIKVEAEEVDVTPSRESIQWTENTRETIKAKFEKVVEIAQKLVNLEMNEKDFLIWMRKCATINAALNQKDATQNISNSVVARLAGIVDLSQLVISYTPDPTMKFSFVTFRGVPIRIFRLETVRKNNKDKVVVKQVRVKSLFEIASYPFVLIDAKTTYTKTRYLLENHYTNGFVGFHVGALEVADEEDDGEGAEDVTGNNVASEMLYSPAEQEHITKLRGYLAASEEAERYSSLQVPEGISYRKKAEAEEDKQEEEEEEETKQSRREKGDTVFSYLVSKQPPYSSAYTPTIHIWNRAVISKNNINSWQNEEVFYGYVNTGDEKLLELCALITRRRDSVFYDTVEEAQSYIGDRSRYNSTNNYRHLLQNTFSHTRTEHQRQLEFADKLSKEYVKGDFSSLNELGYDKLVDVGGSRGEEAFRVLFGVNNNNRDKVRLIRISKSNVRYYRNFRHIHNFFRDVRKINGKNTFTMSNALIRWNTARVIKAMIDKITFYTNFEHEPSLKRRYLALRSYVEKYYREVSGQVLFNTELAAASTQTVEQITAHCDRVMDLQLFVQENPEASDAVVAKMARKLFGAIQTRFGEEVEVQDAWAVDLGLYMDAKQLLEAGTDVAPMLNSIKELVKDNAVISPELYEAIQEYLEFKKFQSPLNKSTCLLQSTETETTSPEPEMESLMPSDSTLTGTLP